MVEKLKPCPFCGSDAFMFSRENGHWAYCSNDECGAETQGKTTHSDAAAAWNRRSALSSAAAAEREPMAWLAEERALFDGRYHERLFSEEPPKGDPRYRKIRPLYLDPPPTSELEALRDRVAELENALRPLQNLADAVFRVDQSGREMYAGKSDDATIWIFDSAKLTYGDLREARRVREGGKVDG